MATARQAIEDIINAARRTNGNAISLRENISDAFNAVFDNTTNSLNFTLDSTSNLTMGAGTYIATDEIRARSASGLTLNDDSGTFGLKILDNGNVGIGTITPGTLLDVNGEITGIQGTLNKLNLGGGLTNFILNGVTLGTVVGASSAIDTELHYVALQHSNTAIAGSRFMFSRSRGTQAVPLIIQNGDSLAALDAAGFDGTDYVLAGQIDFEIDGAPASNDMPGRIVFKTTSDGGILPAERMRINSVGNVGINATTFDATAAKCLTMLNGTAPAAGTANQFYMYAADQVAGNSCPHFMTENSAIVKLYQLAHLADASTSHAVTDPGDTPADADALRDDLVANTIPSIESALNALGTTMNSILTTLESLGFHAVA